MNTMQWAFEKAYINKGLTLAKTGGLAIGESLKSVHERLIK